MAKSKKKEPGRITLRVDEDLHRRLDDTAKALGISLNGLLNLIIRRSLGLFQVPGRWRSVLVNSRLPDVDGPLPEIDEPLQVESPPVRGVGYGGKTARPRRKAPTLRVVRELRERLLDIGVGDLTALLNAMVRHSLRYFEAEARLYREYTRPGKFADAYAVWQTANPAGSPDAFYEELRKHLLGKPSSLDGVEGCLM